MLQNIRWPSFCRYHSSRICIFTIFSLNRMVNGLCNFRSCKLLFLLILMTSAINKTEGLFIRIQKNQLYTLVSARTPTARKFWLAGRGLTTDQLADSEWQNKQPFLFWPISASCDLYLNGGQYLCDNYFHVLFWIRV